MRGIGGLLVAFVLALAMPAGAVLSPDELLKDRALEERARALSRELRCMVCQNQSIDDSDAPLARDLRLLVRERLQAGDSDRQVIVFLTDRYGEFVLLRPRFSWRNALLWLAPAAVLAIGAVALVRIMRRRRRSGALDEVAAPPLSEDERETLAKLVADSTDTVSQPPGMRASD